MRVGIVTKVAEGDDEEITVLGKYLRYGEDRWHPSMPRGGEGEGCEDRDPNWPHMGYTYGDIMTLTKATEDANFYSFTVSDHFFGNVESVDKHAHDA